MTVSDLGPEDRNPTQSQGHSELGRLARRIGTALLVPFVPFALVFAGVYLAVSNAPTHLERMGDRLNRAATFRDGFLVLVAVAYVVGYVVWSLHAWQDHLGLLPALRFQYIFAGLFPLAFAAAVVYVLRGFAYVADIAVAAAVVVSVMIVACALALAVFVLPPLLGRWGLIAYLTFTLLVFVSGPMFGRIGFLRAAMPWVGLTAVAVATALYVSVVYPAVPQELGGVKPRCARLDVKTDELSLSAQRDLGAASTSEAVVRTRAVDLLFVANDFTIVRSRQAQTATTYRIGSGAIVATAEC
jgi:hypothetical protein